MRYYPCELHCHTVHSDGGFTVNALQTSAKENGLSLIALTDHNTQSGFSELDDTIIPVLRGIEWTTYFGHMLVLGADGFVDWRDAVPDNIDEKIAEVKNQNGLVGVAHPFQLGSPMCTGGRWEFNVGDWSKVDYVEIWHMAFSHDNVENRLATEFWTSLLDKGYRLAATNGKDWHRPVEGHFGCTYLLMDEPTPDAAKDAIKNGRTVVSSGAKFFFTADVLGKEYVIGDTVPNGDAVFKVYTDIYSRREFCNEDIVYKEIRIVTNGGKCAAKASLTDSAVNVKLNSGCWYRAELWGAYGGNEVMLAVTSPIYAK
ncbi:MAG: CehA/McbA family metallohydrolase [Eubacterium sp.]|nr:CehA/McbA family metallohydrolase [Eubacterium sp.]